jgi:hypothetical protein
MAASLLSEEVNGMPRVMGAESLMQTVIVIAACFLVSWSAHIAHFSSLN